MHPTLFRFGIHGLSTYAALMALAGVVSLLYLGGFARRMGLRDRGEFWLLANIVVLGGFAGGRLLSLLLHPRVYANVAQLLFASDEGLPTFGVLAGAAAGVWGYCHWLRKDRGKIFDGVFLVAPLGHGIARLGCFMAGCCCGRPALGHFPWTVVFIDPQSEVPRFLLGVPLHPVQLYEAAGDFILAGLLYELVRPRVEKGIWPRGSIAAGYFAGYGLLRFGTEFFRVDATPFFGAWVTVEQALALSAVLIAATLSLGRSQTTR